MNQSFLILWVAGNPDVRASHLCRLDHRSAGPKTARWGCLLTSEAPRVAFRGPGGCFNGQFEGRREALSYEIGSFPPGPSITQAGAQGSRCQQSPIIDGDPG